MSTRVDELISSVLTVNDGIRVISSLEQEQKDSKRLSKGHKEELAEVIEQFKKQFYKIPTVGLTLSFRPSTTFLGDLREWFSQNMKQNIIFDLKVDPEIIGGAKIVCFDHYKDFSLSLKFDKVITGQSASEVFDVPIMPSTLI